MTSWFAELAWLPEGIARDVRFDVEAGRFTAVTVGAVAGDAVRLPGLVLPGFANTHSHAFHRALRGRTQGDGGNFWTWREAMYAVAGRLDPDSYLTLARATYAEMALAGITSVGEFHYLHHAPDGVRYDDPNAMGVALAQAAADAGIRLTLLDTCYLAGGLSADGHTPPTELHLRFGDDDVHRWAARVAELSPGEGLRVGAAVHSVRAVPRDDIAAVAAVAAGRPLHVHLSEQPAENEACQQFYGLTPTGLLESQGALGSTTTAVHATHLSSQDVAALGRSGTTICMCPTTERDLADGIGPARALADAGCPISLGSDQHAVIDAFEEARGLELDERLRWGQRGRFTPVELIAALTNHSSIGWTEAGDLKVGAAADLVGVRLDSVRTAGCLPEQVLYAATTADVDTVIVSGNLIVGGGQHRLGDAGALLAAAIDPLYPPN